MRILFVSDVYLPRVNGVSTSIRSFRGSLESLGHEVRLVVPRYGDEPPERGVTRVPSTPVPFDPEDRRLHRAALRTACRAAAADCDVVHAQTPFLAYYAARDAARHAGRPLVVSYHTYFEGYLHHYVPFLPRTFAAWFARQFSRAQCNAVDALVVPTTAIRKLLEGYGVERPAHVVPTGLDLPLYRDADAIGFRRALGIAPEVPLALHLGRLAHEKNVGFVISAFARVHARMPAARLLIAGEGPATADLQAQVARLGLGDAVTFIGYLTDRRSVAACYAAADAFLFASQTETQGLVLLEAMASGTPVVSVAALGAVEVLPETSGAVVVPPDVAAFADAAGAVLGDAERRAAIVARQHAFVAEWSEAAMTRRLVDVYQGLVQRSPGAVTTPLCEEV